VIIVWIVLAVLLATGIWLDNKSRKWDDTGFGMAVIAGLLLFISLFVWLIVYTEAFTNIEKHYALKEAIENMEGMSELERARVIVGVAELNEFFRKKKFWNETMFDPYIPDKVMELEPLKLK